MTAAEDKRVVASKFISPEGIEFMSYSSEWNEAKLGSLYQVLLNCTHGEELAQLKKVILDPQKSIGTSGYRVGNYNNSEKTIRIFEVDKIRVEKTLIHEYGHHFTYYWLKKKEGIYPYELTEKNQWSKLRQLEGYPIRWKNSSMPYVHKWDPGEIMAEDYVLLFGVSGMPSPESMEELINFTRHENEYIPLVYTIPAVREYWEKAAGLKLPAALNVPEVTDTKLEAGTSDEERPNLRVTFASASDFELNRQGTPIRYAIQMLLFPSAGGAPERSTAVLSSDSIDDDLEARIALPDTIISNETYYGHLSLWAYHDYSRQFTHTPVYEHWFQLRLSDNGYKSAVMRDIPPPWEQQGLYTALRKEGMQRWPMIYLFINGRQQAAGKQYANPDGSLFIPIHALPARHRKTLSPGDMVVRWGGHELMFFARKDDEVAIDGRRVKLKIGLQTFGGDRAIAVSELGRLLGLNPVWKGEENSVVMDGEILLDAQV